MNNKNIGRSALYLVMTLALVACSGGGSSDKEEGGGVPDGKEGKIELDPNGYSTRKASINDLTDFEAATQLYADVLNVGGLIEEVEARIDEWDAPRSSGNRYTWNCENGAGTAVAVISRSDSLDQEQWQFTNCEVRTDSYGRILLNGTYHYVDRLVSQSLKGVNWIGSEEFRMSGTFLTSNEVLKLQGRADWDEILTPTAFAAINRIGALELIRGDRYLALSNVTMNVVGGNDGEAFSLEGNVIGSAINGYVTITTPTAISQPDGVNCPAEGVARITGNDNSYAEIRYGSDSGTSDAAVVEINGNRVKPLTCAEAGGIL